MNKLYFGAAVIASAVISATSSGVVMAKGGDANPASVIIDESGNTVKIDQTGNNNNVKANITNDSSSPVPVTVQNSPTVTVSTEFQLAGYSTRQTDGHAGGIVGMTQLCQQDFGDSARMCTTKDWLTSTSVEHLPDNLSDAWIQPVVVGAIYVPTDPAKIMFIDISGRIMSSTDLAFPKPNTCNQWTSEDGSGMALHTSINDGNQTFIRTASCGDTEKVACCTPVSR